MKSMQSTTRAVIAQSPTPPQPQTSQQPSNIDYAVIVAALITASLSLISVLVTLRSQRKSEQKRLELEKQLEKERREHEREMQSLKAQHEQKLEEMRQANERQKKLDDHRLGLINYWQNYAHHYSHKMRDMTTSTGYAVLVRCLSPKAKEELSRILDEYDKLWAQFEAEELPHMEYEPSGLYRNEYDYEYKRDAWFYEQLKERKKKLGEPLRHFLLEQLAELNERWGLL
jgi:hypothetical protein